MSYAFRSDISKIESRLEIIERALGKNIELAKADLEKERIENCALGNHEWFNSKYDLQGGKWGEDTCKNCGKKKSWSYFMGHYNESIMDDS